MRIRRYYEVGAAVVKLLQDKSLNKADIAVSLGIPRNKAHRKIGPMIEHYHDQGLLYIERWKSKQSPCYRWNPRPFAVDDAKRPASYGQ